MWEDVRRCEKMWEHVRTCENMWEHVRWCENMWEDVRRCEKMWEDEKMRRCEKMWEDVKMWEYNMKMRRCDDKMWWQTCTIRKTLCSDALGNNTIANRSWKFSTVYFSNRPGKESEQTPSKPQRFLRIIEKVTQSFWRLLFTIVGFIICFPLSTSFLSVKIISAHKSSQDSVAASLLIVGSLQPLKD